MEALDQAILDVLEAGSSAKRAPHVLPAGGRDENGPCGQDGERVRRHHAAHIQDARGPALALELHRRPFARCVPIRGFRWRRRRLHRLLSIPLPAKLLAVAAAWLMVGAFGIVVQHDTLRVRITCVESPGSRAGRSTRSSASSGARAPGSRISWPRLRGMAAPTTARSSCGLRGKSCKSSR